MDINIAIIDDTESDYDALCCELHKWEIAARHKLNIKYYDLPTKVIDAYELDNFKYDLLFLDVLMPNMNGIDLIRELQRTNPHILFVLTSSNNTFATDGYGISAFDFLPKPIEPYRLGYIMGRTVAKIDSQRTETFIVETEEQTFRLAYSDVVYFESKANYTFIHTITGDELKTRSPLKTYLDKCPDCFVRISRNCIVNINCVGSYDPYTVKILKSDVCLPLSKSAYPKVVELFKKLI